MKQVLWTLIILSSSRGEAMSSESAQSESPSSLSKPTTLFNSQLFSAPKIKNWKFDDTKGNHSQRIRREVTSDEDSTKKEHRFQCYVCSWGSMDGTVDICSADHLIESAVSTIGCKHGCQTVEFRNSEKEGIRSFYRNCLKTDAGERDQVDKCYKSKITYGIEQRCQCFSSFCNLAPNIRHSLQLLTSAVFVIVILM